MTARNLVLADPALLPRTNRDPFFSPTASASETFNFAGGWSGTIANPTYPDSFTFDSPTASASEDYETGWTGV